jgi:uncharacterized protein YkwD
MLALDYVKTFENRYKRGAQMSLSVSKLRSGCIFSWTATAAALLALIVHQRWSGLRRFGIHLTVGRFARSGLIFIAAIIMLLEPALAAEKRSRAPDQPKKESVAFPSKQDLLTIEESILRLTNKERYTRGLPILRRSSALEYLAGRQTENMCSARLLEHESDVFPKGWKKFTDRMKAAELTSGGENIGYRTLREQPEKWAATVVKEWMGSPPHRKNILNPRWRFLGVGVQMCAKRIAYATQVFSSDPGRIR